MAEKQSPCVVEGVSTGENDEETPVAPKSAEDRKAAAALSSLDTRREEDSASVRDVDQEAVKKAMERLGGGLANGGISRKENESKTVKKNIKLDPADVTLVVGELELTKIKATDLLKAHEGDVGKALRAYIAPVA